jgi:HEAT repeat protein
MEISRRNFMAPSVRDRLQFFRRHNARRHVSRWVTSGRWLALAAIYASVMACSPPSQAADPADGVPRLKQALKSNDEKVRIGAMDALARLGPAAKGAVLDLANLLEDKSPPVRAHAARALRSIGADARDAAPRLAAMAADPDPNVRRMAIDALHAMHPDGSAAIQALAKALEDPDGSVRVAALDALTDFGEPGAEVLAKALENSETRYWAALALGEMGPKAKPAVPGLTSAVKDERAEVRHEALAALAKIGPDAASAAPAAAEALEDPDPSVRVVAAFALGHFGSSAMSAADALKKAIGSQQGMLPTVSAWALARIQPDNVDAHKQAVAMLMAALDGTDTHVRLAALRGLVGLIGEPKELLPVLSKAVSYDDPAIKAEAVAAAVPLGEAAVPIVVQALAGHEGHGAAAHLAAMLGPKAAPAVDALSAAIADKDPEVRREVLLALASLGEAAAPAQTAIAKALDDPEPRVRAIAAYAEGRIGPKAQAEVPRLRREMESADPVVRVASAWALVHIAPNDKQLTASALPVLIQGLKSEVPPVRRGSAEALGRLGKAARSAASALQVASRDSDETVAKAALAALEQVGGIDTSPPRAKAIPKR